MHCGRCHHADVAHGGPDGDMSSSVLGLGACGVPGCACPRYADAMRKIDEELV